MTVNLGYACINMTLQEQKISCNRGMIKRTFQSKGVKYASELALSNVRALKKIIEWNNANGIKVYRMTSCLFPWFSEYDIFTMPDIDAIADVMSEAGEIAMSGNQRLSFHPGPFNCLGSPNEDVVKKTIAELGGAYGEHDKTLERFCHNFSRLSANTQARLTVENDDRASLFSTKMLYDGLSSRIGVPIVFDSHHHELGPQDVSYKEAFYMARETWQSRKVKQQCHHSNSKKHYEDPSVRASAHSDWYYTPFENFGEHVDVVLECKKKELALLKYKQDFEN